jgi:hypothetical protein
MKVLAVNGRARQNGDPALLIVRLMALVDSDPELLWVEMENILSGHPTVPDSLLCREAMNPTFFFE